MKYHPNEEEWHRAMMNHEEPICPECGKGKIICPQGKTERPHYFECTNQCGFHVNIDYNDCIIDNNDCISESLTLYGIYNILEDRYGLDFDCEIEALYIQNPEDEMLKYCYDRINNFKVWEEKAALYDELDPVARTMFITLTDRYGAGWKLHDLIKAHPDDDLPKEFDSYLNYLDRVADLYSFLKKTGCDLNSI